MPRATFRELLAGERPLLMPVAYDTLTALMIQEAGFKAAGVGGLGLIASRLGLPDVGLASFGEIVATVRDLHDAVDLTLTIDADDGYGDVKNVTRTVQVYERMGVGGISIEDQTSPKRCGHTAGKSVVAREVIEAKLKAALDARKSDDFWIFARTDAGAVLGLDEAMERARRFEELGADVLFIEAPATLEQLAVIGKSFAKPLIINAAEGGKTPFLSARQYGEMGFSMILYPGTLLLRFLATGRKALADVKADRIHETTKDLPAFKDFLGLTGMPEWIAVEEKFAPKSPS